MSEVFTVHETVTCYPNGVPYTACQYRHGHTATALAARKWIEARCKQFTREGERYELDWGNNGAVVLNPSGQVRLYYWFEESLPL